MEKNFSLLLLRMLFRIILGIGDRHQNKTKLQRFFTESASNATDKKIYEDHPNEAVYL